MGAHASDKGTPWPGSVGLLNAVFEYQTAVNSRVEGGSPTAASGIPFCTGSANFVPGLPHEVVLGWAAGWVDGPVLQQAVSQLPAIMHKASDAAVVAQPRHTSGSPTARVLLGGRRTRGGAVGDPCMQTPRLHGWLTTKSAYRVCCWYMLCGCAAEQRRAACVQHHPGPRAPEQRAGPSDHAVVAGVP